MTHTFRHSFTTHLLENGTTLIYTHVMNRGPTVYEALSTSYRRESLTPTAKASQDPTGAAE
jgi:hypothetical protein